MTEGRLSRQLARCTISRFPFKFVPGDSTSTILQIYVKGFPDRSYACLDGLLQMMALANWMWPTNSHPV